MISVEYTVICDCHGSHI